VLGVIGHGDADLFVAEGIGQLAGMVPAVGGVGLGGELYGVSAAERVAEAGSVEGHGWALVDVVGVGHFEGMVLSRPKFRFYREGNVFA
jgi:hypothetical protein